MMKTTRLLLTFILLSVAASAQQRDTIRVCAYTLHDAWAASIRSTAEPLRLILRAIDPDIILFQSISETNEVMLMLRDSVLYYQTEPRHYFPPTVNGNGTDNALAYDSTRFMYIGSAYKSNGPHAIQGWLLLSRSTGDTILVHSVNLDDGDEGTRLEDTWKLRLALARRTPGIKVILTGKISIASSSDPSYQEMVDPQAQPNAAYLVDPVGRPGVWSNNEAYSDLATYGTRIRRVGSRVIGGGMKHRYDHILLSPSMMTHYIPGSYTTFGNDGQHFNDSINALPNLAVDSAMAQALFDVGHYLPVYLDLVLGGPASSVEEDGQPSPAWRSKEMDLSMEVPKNK